MAVFKLAKGLTVFLLSLQQVLIPLLVELLILLDVGLFALFSLLSLIEDEFLHATIVILLLQLSDTILCHFGLNIFSLLLASKPMVFKDFTVNLLEIGDSNKFFKVYNSIDHLHKVLNIVSVGLLIKSLLFVHLIFHCI